VLDLWQTGQPTKNGFHDGGKLETRRSRLRIRGVTYYWSKHREYLKFIDLPKRTTQPVELATGLIQLSPEDSNVLKSNGCV